MAKKPTDFIISAIINEFYLPMIADLIKNKLKDDRELQIAFENNEDFEIVAKVIDKKVNLYLTKGFK